MPFWAFIFDIYKYILYLSFRYILSELNRRDLLENVSTHMHIGIGAEQGGAAGARAPPLLHNPRKFIL